MVEMYFSIFLFCICHYFLFQIDNKGNHLLVSEEASINVPAIAAAHVTKRYTAQATDELTFEVTSVIYEIWEAKSYFWYHHNAILNMLSCDFILLVTLSGIQVGDIVSVIDMPPKEDTGWWRGKHGFQVIHMLYFIHIVVVS